MKNQYFGDINDYLKYGLLRIIGQATGYRLAVCWMLTPDDGHTDGKKTGYADRPSEWRAYDPLLFDVLKTAITTGRRNIDLAETEHILPGAVYHSEILGDDRESRRHYFQRLEAGTTARDLVFFDPDNGMEVKSRPKGRRGSSKYLHWDEAKQFSAMGKSLIVFQHFARVKRDVFIAGLRDRFKTECGAGWVGVLRTSNVAYFVVPAPAHVQRLRAACSTVGQLWPPHIRCDDVSSRDGTMRLATDQLECRPIKHGSPEYQATVALRNAVLRKPLGLLLTAAEIRAEHCDHHLACFLDGNLFGCLVLTAKDGGKVRMRQVAVAMDCQRRGVGTALVRYSERYAAEHGYREMYAHARDAAVPFYTRLDYEVVGNRFFEVGIPHFEVRKQLANAHTPSVDARR